MLCSVQPTNYSWRADATLLISGRSSLCFFLSLSCRVLFSFSQLDLSLQTENYYDNSAKVTQMNQWAKEEKWADAEVKKKDWMAWILSSWTGGWWKLVYDFAGLLLAFCLLPAAFSRRQLNNLNWARAFMYSTLYTFQGVALNVFNIASYEGKMWIDTEASLRNSELSLFWQSIGRPFSSFSTVVTLLCEWVRVYSSSSFFPKYRMSFIRSLARIILSLNCNGSLAQWL